jgi:hypothetical protein
MAVFRKRAEPGAGAGEWYYCLRHKTVEEGMQCPAKNRLGPYATRTEADHALDRVRERNEDWDSAD